MTSKILIGDGKLNHRRRIMADGSVYESADIDGQNGVVAHNPSMEQLTAIFAGRLAAIKSQSIDASAAGPPKQPQPPKNPKEPKLPKPPAQVAKPDGGAASAVAVGIEGNNVLSVHHKGRAVVAAAPPAVVAASVASAAVDRKSSAAVDHKDQKLPPAAANAPGGIRFGPDFSDDESSESAVSTDDDGLDNDGNDDDQPGSAFDSSKK